MVSIASPPRINATFVLAKHKDRGGRAISKLDSRFVAWLTVAPTRLTQTSPAMADTSSFTESTLLANAAFSSLVSSNSTTRSTPLDPSTTGTPT